MRLKLIGILVFLCISGTSYADSTQVGRYITKPNKPVLSQMDLLSQTIQIRFPQDIKTIANAVDHLLSFIGYSLVDKNNMQPALQTILTKPLPLIDRELGPMSLKDGLLTLVGPAFSLEKDLINRTVNFKLKPVYAKRYALSMKENKKRG